jgi:small subunit ribosomal protein S6
VATCGLRGSNRLFVEEIFRRCRYRKMKKYELILLFKPTLTADEVTESVKKIEALVASSGGSEIKVDTMGRKELAFEMNKASYATYVAIHYTSDASDCGATITKTLRITDSLLKFQTHKIVERHRATKQSRAAAKSGAAASA